MTDTRLTMWNVEYKAITGHDAYLYSTSPGTGSTKYVFATSYAPMIGEGAALDHMADVLNKVRTGWTHDEIVFGKERSN